jgi:hypothetical protein
VNITIRVLPHAAVDTAVFEDMASVNAALDSIDDEPLSSSVGSLNTAVDAVPSFADAAPSTLSSVLQPLATVQSRVQTLIQANTVALSAVPVFGGVVPNTPFSQVADSLNGQTGNMLQANTLFQLRNVLGRLSANLASANTPPQQIATDQYGDATAWTALAAANGLTDPFVTGSATLAVPKSPGSSAASWNRDRAAIAAGADGSGAIVNWPRSHSDERDDGT